LGWIFYHFLLAGGLEHFYFSFFPYIGNNHPNWLIFFTGVGIPPTSLPLPIPMEIDNTFLLRQKYSQGHRTVDDCILKMDMVNNWLPVWLSVCEIYKTMS
jgi:hypothetical protein